MRAAFTVTRFSVALACIFIIASNIVCSALEVGEQKSQTRRPWLMIGLGPDVYSNGCSGGCRHVFSVVKQLSGSPDGVLVHFSKVTYEMVTKLNPEFIVLSPQGTPWCRYTGDTGVAMQNFLWLLPMLAEEMDVPMLGICGGHQAIALAFGGKVGPIRGGEDDCMPYSRARQGGIYTLTIQTGDPIFDGCNEKIRMLESHYDEVKVLPPGFLLLASEKVSPLQIMRHATKPIYGIQGHPEHFNAIRPEPGMIIRNFLKIVSDRQKNRDAVPQPPVAAAEENPAPALAN
jgi:GMP synthase (glutamine-hydrolysing)